MGIKYIARLPTVRVTCQDRVRREVNGRNGGVMAQRGFAVAAFREAGQWRCEPLPPAVQVLARLGEEPPEDDELDEVWPIGDLDLFTDLGFTEDEMERVLDDLDAYPDEMLETVVEGIGLAEAYAQATESARV